MTLGEQIRAARTAKAMTLRQLARTLGVSAPYLSDVEHDRRGLSDKNIERAAKILGIDPALLDAARGYTRDLADWLRGEPELVEWLRRARREPMRIGGENCPCRHVSRRTGER